MKKNVTILFLSTCLALCASGQVRHFDAYVESAGQLAVVLGDRANEIDSLVVHGPVDATDFKTMWSCAFRGQLTALNLADADVSEKEIPDYAFYDPEEQGMEEHTICLNLRRIILPDDIVRLGSGAFAYMMLERINLPASLQILGQCCFADCHELWFDELTIPEGVTDIPLQCFIDCKGFGKIAFPPTLKTIYVGAFQGTSIGEVDFSEGLECIGDLAFFGVKNLRRAILPNSCRYLEWEVFSENDSLREIRFPEGIPGIPWSVASKCPKLETVWIPESVERILFDAFYMCENLRTVNLPSRLRQIDDRAFYGCPLDSVVLPAKVERIAREAFGSNSHLSKIYSLSPTPPECYSETFGDVSHDIPVYVPVGSAELYRQAGGWNMFTNYIELSEFPFAGVETIPLNPDSGVKVYGRNGNLVVECADSQPTGGYAVYGIDGKPVAQGVAGSLPVEIPLPSGLYIVRVGRSVYKVRL